MLGTTKPPVSNHLRVLRDQRLVDVAVHAQRGPYRLHSEPLAEMDEWLATVVEHSFALLQGVRTCSSCGRSFRPSSRHRRCPSCRSIDQCPCGAPKQRKSATCATCRVSSGAANGHWKGGRTYHKAGYRMVLDRRHPRASSSGYVFEHILVMEATLGRPLWPDENVHHRNGVRDDNRPENLELWVRPQPPGIRVEDAVAWARQILARYGGAEGTTDNGT